MVAQPVSMSIKASPEQLRSLAAALEMLDKVETETGVCISPNMRLELGIGNAWVAIGRDENNRHVIDDRIGD